MALMRGRCKSIHGSCGRDVLSRIVWGARVSLRVGLAGARAALKYVARPEARVEGVVHIADPDPRRCFALIAARFFAGNVLVGRGVVFGAVATGAAECAPDWVRT